MLQLSDYALQEALHRGQDTQIVRALHLPSGDTVVVKMPVGSPPSLRAIGRLVHEHRLLTQLAHIPGVIHVLALEQQAGNVALVLQDPGLRSLHLLLAERAPLSVEAVARMGVSLCQILSQIHAAGVIHRDIKPQNILVSEDFSRLILLDFGIASELPQEAVEAAIPEALEGTLAYISPEQTGRTARAVDSRTDLYSLGVTLFELLTGRLPFQEKDALALLYAHLAKPAPDVASVRREVPAGLCAIVARMLEKDVERRYQTAHGAGRDLERVLLAWQTPGGVDRFALGSEDRSPRLRLPQLLLGREEQVKQLKAAFEEVAHGSVGRGGEGHVGLLLVAGPSGIGKTALVRTVYRSIARHGRGLVLSGKHDQLARSTPFAAMAQAFGGLMRQWLASPAEVLGSWRQKIREQVGDNARLIADVVPELDVAMGGKLAPVAPVQGDMIFQRQKLTWLNFVQAVSAPSAPLVLFLDDMQWADSATLMMLQALLTDREQPGLLVICAYRDNETPPEHPLWEMVKTVESRATQVRRVEVGPLPQEQVGQWLAHTLQSDVERVEPLAEVLWQKTRGNPFFLEQLVLTLHRSKLVVRGEPSGAWGWDLGGIERAQVTENVVELLTEKVKQMPSATVEILGLAACWGHRFHLRDLEGLSGWDRGRVVSALLPAMHEELVVPLDGSYRPAQALVQGSLDAEYRFLHDRVQQACYERIAPKQRSVAHLDIGRRLGKMRERQGATEQELLDVVRHLNLGAAEMTPGCERVELSGLNLEGAQAAKRVGAYELMAALAESGMALLEKGWEQHPKRMTELSLERLEAAFLLRAFAQVEERAGELLSRALPWLPWLAVQEVRMRTLLVQGQYEKGMALGREVSPALGFKLPDTPQRCHEYVSAGLAEIDHRFEQDPGVFEKMPLDLAPERTLTGLVCLHFVQHAAYSGNPTLAAAIGLHHIKDTFESGVLGMFGGALLGVMGQGFSAMTGAYRRAAKWHEIAYDAAKRSHTEGWSAYFRGESGLYSRPVAEAEVHYTECKDYGIRNGDATIVSWGLIGELLDYRAWYGTPLEFVDAFREQQTGICDQLATRPEAELRRADLGRPGVIRQPRS